MANSLGMIYVIGARSCQIKFSPMHIEELYRKTIIRPESPDFI